LTVIFFPLVALHHSSCCKLPTGGSSGYCLHRSGNDPQLQRVHYGGNESINCNGTGALGQLQRRAMIDQLIATGQQRRQRSIAIAMALGHWGNMSNRSNGKRNGATALWSLPLQ
jgi:hypothetical protein